MIKTIIGLTLGSILFALGLPAEAQQAGRVSRIGFLNTGSSGFRASAGYDSFRQGLRELGYIEGKNIFIEIRDAEVKQDQLSYFATELVKLKVDVIVTSTTPGVLAAKNATNVIPIVFWSVGDPVGTGLVSSLARPGGNITGLSILSPELGGKRLELLKETFPKITKVASFGIRALQEPGGQQCWRQPEHLDCNFNPWRCGAPKISTVRSKRY